MEQSTVLHRKAIARLDINESDTQESSGLNSFDIPGHFPIGEGFHTTRWSIWQSVGSATMLHVYASSYTQRYRGSSLQTSFLTGLQQLL